MNKTDSSSAAGGRAASPIPRAVWLLGWASLFTDAATEMIYPLLPAYLVVTLGAGAVSLGLIEGIAEAVNSFVKIASGYWSDHRSRRRPLVIAGYSISSFARPFIALTTSWVQVLAIRAIDRTGKGMRGAPRDAMLTRFGAREVRGRIFGFHRAMDHSGAIVGPLVATAMLYFAPENYRLVFAAAAIPGVIAVAVLFRVKEAPDAPSAVAVPASPAPAAATPAGRFPRPLLSFFGVVLIFSLGNSSDAFLLLRLGDALGSAAVVPLLWAALHIIKAGLSTWGGGLSDRWGRRPVIVAGWSIYAIVYAGFAISTSNAAFIAWFLLYGVYFALSEGAEKALVADLAPAPQRGVAFGVFNAALGVGALAASVTFGVLYERFGPSTAFGTGAALAVVASALLLSGTGDIIRGSDASNSRDQ